MKQPLRFQIRSGWEQGLKPDHLRLFSAWLKPCPDTKHEGCGLEKGCEVPVHSSLKLAQPSQLLWRPGIAAYFTQRSRRILLTIGILWALLYGSFTLLRPPLLDDADSVHAEVAREMVARHDWVTLYANGIRYLEKAPLPYWLVALGPYFGLWLLRAARIAIHR